jgi:3-oxoacyl-(acyl-carrier-protein) synthase
LKRVVVTGIGAISSIGLDAQENLNSLRNGIGGIGQSKFFVSKYAQTHALGEVKASDEELRLMLGIGDKKGLTRSDLLALKAVKEAITDAGLDDKALRSFDTALISASTVGGMCLTDQLYQDANNASGPSDFIRSYSASAHTFCIAKRYGIKGITDTLNTACSSSANAIMVGSRLIKSGRAKRVIVGGVDSLAKYTVNGFNALGILSPTATKPFDANRIGLSLGEAAAYLILEDLEEVKGTQVYAEIKGYGNASDAYHTSSISDDADGVVLAIRQALDSAKLLPSDIHYINAHGTGTGNNDKAEVVGFSTVFGSAAPPFNSTKSYTGHTLGASGALEAIFSIFSIKYGELYPSLSFETPIEAPHGLIPIKCYQKDVEISNVLSNSYGFSGSCTSLVISKV